MPHRTLRTTSLRQILTEHRRAILGGVQSRIRAGRTDRTAEVRDEHAVADIEEDISLALLQLGADTLTRIDDALGRLAAGTYGVCTDCEEEISEPRLRALPFAVRCRACEARREQLQLHARQRGGQDGGLSGFRAAVGL
jgi:DnaK suppressor protein